MLTKEERKATIERIKSYGDSDLPFYELLFGSRAPYAMQYTEYLKALKDRIIDLCDTSNMIELPRDKDGEVIRPDDVVYTDCGTQFIVVGYMADGNEANIVVENSVSRISTRKCADILTHKQPITIQSLARQIKNVLDDDGSYMPNSAFFILSRIVDQLEHLGDNDD